MIITMTLFYIINFNERIIMSESTFIFIVLLTFLLIIFTIAGFCVAVWLRINEKRYHERVQNKVINLEKMKARK